MRCELLCDVPLGTERRQPAARTLHYGRPSSAALREQAEGEFVRPQRYGGAGRVQLENGKRGCADYELHRKARAVISRAIRTDADETDIARVTNAIRKLNKEDGREEDDDGDQRKPYLAREEA